MLKETELKEKLQTLAQNEFHPSEKEHLAELIPAMLNYIGTTDSYLRDELIYSAFGTWILHHKVLSPEQLRSLLPIILDKHHMLYKIGEQDTDSVFTRSFSILVLPLLLMTHRSDTLFSASEINHIKEQLLYYLENEKDCRGFVPEKGWAHAIAHAADTLDDLAQCTEINTLELVEILEAIRKVVCVESVCYVHLEDERMVNAVISILRRNLVADVEIIQWIEGFYDQAVAITSGSETHSISVNVKNFLQSLYFRLLWEGMINNLDAPIHQTLRKINPFARQAGS